jgi:hypothetical protein
MEKKLQERTIWQKLRPSLKSYKLDDNWISSIELFETRIREKYFNPILLLIKHGNTEGVGFAIVAIECILIETFAAFKTGVIYNNRYNEEKDPPYQYCDSQDIFVNFLNSEELFKNYFNEEPKEVEDKHVVFSANKFYVDVRCGLLHEGRTKKDWTINLKPKEETLGVLFGKDGNKKKIYRTILYKLLNKYFESYLNDLKLDSEKGELLRKNFARKLDNLYNFKPNSKRFDWWTC